MTYAPAARIVLRYVVGAALGVAWADALAADPDVIAVVAALIGGAVEFVYIAAKRRGWAT